MSSDAEVTMSSEGVEVVIKAKSETSTFETLTLPNGDVIDVSESGAELEYRYLVTENDLYTFVLTLSNNTTESIFVNVTELGDAILEVENNTISIYYEDAKKATIEEIISIAGAVSTDEFGNELGIEISQADLEKIHLSKAEDIINIVLTSTNETSGKTSSISISVIINADIVVGIPNIYTNVLTLYLKSDEIAVLTEEEILTKLGAYAKDEFGEYVGVYFKESDLQSINAMTVSVNKSFLLYATHEVSGVTTTLAIQFRCEDMKTVEFNWEVTGWTKADGVIGKNINVYDENLNLIDTYVITQESDLVLLPDVPADFDVWYAYTDNYGNIVVKPRYYTEIIILKDSNGKTVSVYEVNIGRTVTEYDENGVIVNTTVVEEFTSSVVLGELPEGYDSWFTYQDTQTNVIAKPAISTTLKDPNGNTLGEVTYVPGANITVTDKDGNGTSVELDENNEIVLPSLPGTDYEWVVEYDEDANITIKPVLTYTEVVVKDADGNDLGTFLVKIDEDIIVEDGNGSVLERIPVTTETTEIILPVLPGVYDSWEVVEKDKILNIIPQNTHVDLDLGENGIHKAEIGKDLIITDEEGTETRVEVTESTTESDLPMLPADYLWEAKNDEEGNTELTAVKSLVLVTIYDDENNLIDSRYVKVEKEVNIIDEEGNKVTYPVEFEMSDIIIPTIAENYYWDISVDAEGNLIVEACETHINVEIKDSNGNIVSNENIEVGKDIIIKNENGFIVNQSTVNKDTVEFELPILPEGYESWETEFDEDGNLVIVPKDTHYDLVFKDEDGNTVGDVSVEIGKDIIINNEDGTVTKIPVIEDAATVILPNISDELIYDFTTDDEGNLVVDVIDKEISLDIEGLKDPVKVEIGSNIVVENTDGTTTKIPVTSTTTGTDVKLPTLSEKFDWEVSTDDDGNVVIKPMQTHVDITITNSNGEYVTTETVEIGKDIIVKDENGFIVDQFTTDKETTGVVLPNSQEGYESWATEYDEEGNLIINPTKTHSKVDIKDEDGNILGNVSVEIGKDIIVNNQDGTTTKIPVDEANNVIILPTLNDDFVYDIVIDDLGNLVVTPVLKPVEDTLLNGGGTITVVPPSQSNDDVNDLDNNSENSDQTEDDQYIDSEESEEDDSSDVDADKNSVDVYDTNGDIIGKIEIEDGTQVFVQDENGEILGELVPENGKVTIPDIYVDGVIEGWYSVVDENGNVVFKAIITTPTMNETTFDETEVDDQKTDLDTNEYNNEETDPNSEEILNEKDEENEETDENDENVSTQVPQTNDNNTFVAWFAMLGVSILAFFVNNRKKVK